MNNLPSFIDEVCTKLEFEQLFVPFGLETSERNPVKCLSPRREANKIIHSFVSSRFDFLFGYIINILLTELGRSVWENLDLGRCADLTAFGLYWRPRSRFSHTDLPLG